MRKNSLTERGQMLCVAIRLRPVPQWSSKNSILLNSYGHCVTILAVITSLVYREPWINVTVNRTRTNS